MHSSYALSSDDFAVERGGEAVGALSDLWPGGYQPGDRSWNLAGDGAVVNPTGRIGAVIADVLLQSLWLAAALPILVMLAWGLRLVVHRPVGRGDRFRSTGALFFLNDGRSTADVFSSSTSSCTPVSSAPSSLLIPARSG